MTPADRDEFRRMLVNALQPMQEQIDALKRAPDSVEPLQRQLEALQKKDSGQHRFVTTELLPKMQGEAEKTRAADLSAIAAAVTRLVDVTNETAERQARTEQNVALIVRQNQFAVVEREGEQGRSLMPASLAAANDTQIMKVDVKAQSATSDGISKWQKRVVAPLVVLVPILIEVYRQLSHH